MNGEGVHPDTSGIGYPLINGHGEEDRHWWVCTHSHFIRWVRGGRWWAWGHLGYTGNISIVRGELMETEVHSAKQATKAWAAFHQIMRPFDEAKGHHSYHTHQPSSNYGMTWSYTGDLGWQCWLSHSNSTSNTHTSKWHRCLRHPTYETSVFILVFLYFGFLDLCTQKGSIFLDLYSSSACSII